MKLHPSVPSLCHSYCSLIWVGIPDEFTLNLAFNISIIQPTCSQALSPGFCLHPLQLLVIN